MIQILNWVINKFVDNPKKLFLFDSIGATLSALFLILFQFEFFITEPNQYFIWLIILAFLLSIYSLFCFLFLKGNYPIFVQFLYVANSIYYIASAVMISIYIKYLSLFGILYFIIEIMIIITLIYLELKTYKKLKHTLYQSMNLNFRKATSAEIDLIWSILQQAILRRKQDGSEQWQDGYPNVTIVANDIAKGCGYVLTENDTIIGYASLVFNDEPAYAKLEGNWLSNGNFVVLHRVALTEAYLGKGLAQKIMLYAEQIAIENKIYSIKVDTNFDNTAMLRIFNKLGYVYCGEVEFRGSKRKAFEKLLSK